MNTTLGGRYAGTWPEEPAHAWVAENRGGLGKVSETSLHSHSHSRRFMVHALLGGWKGSKWAEYLGIKSEYCLVLSKLPIICLEGARIQPLLEWLLVTTWSGRKILS